MSGQCVRGTSIILLTFLFLEMNVEVSSKSLQQVCKAVAWSSMFIYIFIFLWACWVKSQWKECCKPASECGFLTSSISKGLFLLSLMGTLSDRNVGFF